MRLLDTNNNWIKVTVFAVIFFFPFPVFSSEPSFNTYQVMVETATIDGGYCKEYGGTKFPLDLDGSRIFNKSEIGRYLRMTGGKREPQVILTGRANFSFGRGLMTIDEELNGENLNLPPKLCTASFDGPLKNGNLELEAKCERGIEFKTQARCMVQLRDVRDCFYKTEFSSAARFESSKVSCIGSSKEERNAYREAYIDYWGGMKK